MMKSTLPDATRLGDALCCYTGLDGDVDCATVTDACSDGSNVIVRGAATNHGGSRVYHGGST